MQNFQVSVPKWVWMALPMAHMHPETILDGIVPCAKERERSTVGPCQIGDAHVACVKDNKKGKWYVSDTLAVFHVVLTCPVPLETGFGGHASLHRSFQ